MDDRVTAAVEKAKEFEPLDWEYAADLLNDLDDEHPDNHTIVVQWFRKIRTETILTFTSGQTNHAYPVNAHRS